MFANNYTQTKLKGSKHYALSKAFQKDGSDTLKALWGLTERHLAGEHTEAACRSSKHRGLLWDLLLKQTSTDDRGMSCS